MKCPDCGEEMYPTHDIADARVWECDKCERHVSYEVLPPDPIYGEMGYFDECDSSTSTNTGEENES